MNLYSLKKAFIGVIIVVLFIHVATSADDLTLMDIIIVEGIGEDEAEIKSVTFIGDFNADGYNDLLVGVCIGIATLEASYLYYGGPGFDTQPDLIFKGDVNEPGGPCSPNEPVGFGWRACDLGDFNGDGYDDIAISAFFLCVNDMYDGRIYIYLGSSDPDTTADVIIDGEIFRDHMGETLVSGDFNGDGFDDLLTCAPNYPYGHRAYIYLGDQLPDNEEDYLYDYSYTQIRLNDFAGGFDLNDDGADEFCWTNHDTTWFFFGGDSISQEPYYLENLFIVFAGDVSEDGIDDIIVGEVGEVGEENELNICLGGEDFDFIPDYYMWTMPPYWGPESVIYDFAGIGKKLIVDNYSDDNFRLFNLGVPFDSIPFIIYDCENRLTGARNPYINDINADQNKDLGIVYYADSLRNKLFIYSMMQTGIDDNSDIIPQRTKILSAYPNPFNSSTIIGYSNIEGGEIEIYNIAGQLVRTFNISNRKKCKVIWDATDDSGKTVSSGIYFARAKNGGNNGTIKLVYLR